MTAAGNEEIEQAVAVEVEHGQAAAQRFEDGVMVRLLAVAIGEVDAGLSRHVLKQRRANRLRLVGDGRAGRGGPAAGASGQQEVRHQEDRHRAGTLLPVSPRTANFRNVGT